MRVRVDRTCTLEKLEPRETVTVVVAAVVIVVVNERREVTGTPIRRSQLKLDSIKFKHRRAERVRSHSRTMR